MKTRECLYCGESIAHRHGNADFCNYVCKVARDAPPQRRGPLRGPAAPKIALGRFVTLDQAMGGSR